LIFFRKDLNHFLGTSKNQNTGGQGPCGYVIDPTPDFLYLHIVSLISIFLVRARKRFDFERSHPWMGALELFRVVGLCAISLLTTGCPPGAEPIVDQHPTRTPITSSQPATQNALSLLARAPTLRIRFSSLTPYPLSIQAHPGSLSQALSLPQSPIQSREAALEAWDRLWEELAPLFDLPSHLDGLTWQLSPHQLRLDTGWARFQLTVRGTSIFGAWALLHWASRTLLPGSALPGSSPQESTLLEGELLDVIIRLPSLPGLNSLPLTPDPSPTDFRLGHGAQAIAPLPTHPQLPQIPTPDLNRSNRLNSTALQVPLSWDPLQTFGVPWIRVKQTQPQSQSTDDRFESLRQIWDVDGKLIAEWDEIPSAITQAPSDWFETSAPINLNAINSQGTPKDIPSRGGPASALLSSLTSPFSASTYSGFGFPTSSQQTITVSVYDLSSDSRRARIPLTPSAISCNASPCQWTEESQWGSPQQAVTGLILQLRTTLEWFHSQMDLNSWDNHGSPVYAATSAIRNSQDPDELNAWGFGGKILVSAGRTRGNFFASDALEVVAHEFTHSVISTLSGFSTSGEAGALHEAIADFFGMRVLHQTHPEHQSFTFGGSIDWNLRDVLNPQAPENSGLPLLPDRYSQYRIYSLQEDLGGVHINSGIFSAALHRTVYTHDGHRTRDPNLLARHLLTTLSSIPWDSSTRMEELAAGLLALCRPELLESAQRQGFSDLCPALNQQLETSELLKPHLGAQASSGTR
jgi:hypothetical protein